MNDKKKFENRDLKNPKEGQLVLIDGHAILHRAYHALPPLTTRSGELVNAVYGFCTILLKVIDDLKPKYLAVAFDTPKPTFRQDIFIGYQAQRPKMEEELAGQIEKIQKVLGVFKIPIFAVEGYEADDVIATIAKRAAEKQEVIIVSGDKDLFQLVDKRIKIYMPIRGLSEAQLFGEKEVEEKMGVKPNQIVDYKALVGDASDNYPGVPGIGPKTAVDLLEKFETLENIYRSVDKIKNQALKEKLIKGRENAELSKKLATIINNVPVSFDWKKSRLGDLGSEEALAILRQFGFKSLIGRITGEKPKKNKKEEETRQEKLF